jgi:hypothetical protein
MERIILAVLSEGVAIRIRSDDLPFVTTEAQRPVIFHPSLHAGGFGIWIMARKADELGFVRMAVYGVFL